MGTTQSREQQSNDLKKNAGAIPTPISRWLHKLLQSEVESNNCQSVSGRAGVDEFTLLAQ